MNHWIGYIKCDMCDLKIKLDDVNLYNDLNICKFCKQGVDERAKKKPKHPMDDYFYKR